MRRFVAIRVGLLAVAFLLTLPALAHAAPVDWHSEWQGRKESVLDTLRAKRVWAADDVVLVTLIACDELGVESDYLTATIPRLAYRESRFDTEAANCASSARGLMQFLAAWGSEEKRMDGVWSVYRVVALYRDGGAQKIRQHWALTY